SDQLHFTVSGPITNVAAPARVVDGEICVAPSGRPRTTRPASGYTDEVPPPQCAGPEIVYWRCGVAAGTVAPRTYAGLSTPCCTRDVSPRFGSMAASAVPW